MADAAAPPLLLTMGEPAGIGGELTLQAWLRRAEGVPVFAAHDDPARLEALAATLGWTVPIRRIVDPREAPQVWPQALPVLPLPMAVAAEPGRPSPATAEAVIASIAAGCAWVAQGAAQALVTNPIQKSALTAAGFGFPGHTEFLASLAALRTPPVMMLVGAGLRVVPLTVHVPLAAVPGLLTVAGIASMAEIVAAALTRDFGIARPRLAFAGLNPHAGEDGTIGREEIDILIPAVARLQAAGIDAVGPLPADTLFHPAARARYDVALCPTHDQALIPLKTLAFDSGVNVTLGLPFVRTSPDHGTALDIAGSGRANPSSLLEALRLAAATVAARQSRQDRPQA